MITAGLEGGGGWGRGSICLQILLLLVLALSLFIFQVDCTMFEKLCDKYNIEQYPVLKWFKDGKTVSSFIFIVDQEKSGYQVNILFISP